MGTSVTLALAVVLISARASMGHTSFCFVHWASSLPDGYYYFQL